MIEPVITWTDLRCGCSESDTGSVIVSLRCPVWHTSLVGPERVEAAVKGAGGGSGQFGPIPRPEG